MNSARGLRVASYVTPVVVGVAVVAATAGFNVGQRLLFTALASISVVFVIEWWRCRDRLGHLPGPNFGDAATGFLVAMGDTLGIGSFAPTTAILKMRKRVPDEQIPGTLNIGLALAGMIESFIFVKSVLVDPLLLVTVIAAASLGAWLGAGVVGRLPRRTIQFAMGAALLIACLVFAAVNMDWLPGGGTAMALTGWKFAVAVGLNFVFGALMSVGIGLYAPCMILLALLGMNPIAAFPIMMGACALLQPVASLRFFKNERFSWGASIGLTLGCPFGVFVAAYVIKSLDMRYLRWLVTAVVLYASIAMLRSAFARGATPETARRT